MSASAYSPSAVPVCQFSTRQFSTGPVSSNSASEIIKAIKYVDEVVPQLDKNKLGAWNQYHFDKMFVGSDWQGTPQWKKYEEEFTPIGVEIVYLPHTNGISSTELRNLLDKQSDQNDENRTSNIADVVTGTLRGGDF